MSALSFFIILFAGGTAGNDLLDFVPAEAYFKLAGVELNVESLTEVLEAPPAGDPAARPGDSARRQLALRALGDLKDAAALPVIAKHLASEDPLVADYAQAARAAIRGEAYTRPAPDAEDLRADLACLPSGVGVIGRLSAAAGTGPVELVEKMKELNDQLEKRGGHVLGGGEIEEMEEQLLFMQSKMISMLGNVRLNTITFGVASDIGEDSGFVVALARGLYDHEAAERLFAEFAEGGVREAGGLNFFELSDEHLFAAPVSDELFVFAAGPSLQEIPLAEVGEKVLAGGGDFAIGRDQAMLLDRADTEAPLWALMKVSEAYKQVPFFAPFDTMVLEGKRAAGGKTKLAVTGRGGDPEAVAEVVGQVNEMLGDVRRKVARQAEDFPPALVFDDMLKSVKVVADGGTATLTGELPEGGAMAALPMIILGNAAPLPHPVPAPPAVEEELRAEPEEVAPAPE